MNAIWDADALRRFPDVEAANLHAVDAADRLLLDEAAGALSLLGPGELVVVGDHYGGLALAAAALHGLRGIRVHQDPLSGELALSANAEALGLSGSYRSADLDGELFSGARLVLMQLPRGLAALEEIVELIALTAEPSVVVYAGGRIKHMTPAMNDVLSRHFVRVDVSLARQKSRVLRAGELRRSVVRSPVQGRQLDPVWPRVQFHSDIGMYVAAHGDAFAGTSVDIGTRFLLQHLDDASPEAETAIDLGCGTGILGTALAMRRPAIRVIASDQSAAAVASTLATVRANEVNDRVSVVRDDALGAQASSSAEFIVLNPPFHLGPAVHAGIALKLFEDVGRVLAPEGELWCVWNSHLAYVPVLERLIGSTRQIARNSKFTITASRRRG
ncbi:class I SAM-dependent methyltransferase [Luethyella okanaganae]|uniref:Class I SAM-dependent methyltransferase n=1 Tax=Luethyella okanaganae TaxID=69372 RepID=A0ABW1VGY3_9MICO